MLQLLLVGGQTGDRLAMNFDLQLCQGAGMPQQCPWTGVQILEHGGPLHPFVDQAAPSVDFYDLSDGRSRDTCTMDGVRDP
jgi:hypothetical protein